MPLFNIDAIVTRVYDLVRTDSRTSALNWHNGRRSPDQMNQLPAGNVFLSATPVGEAYSSPKGEAARLVVTVQVVYGSHEGSAEVERLLRNGIDSLADVLLDEWTLGLDYAWPEALLGGAVGVNPEASPAIAVADFQLQIRVIPTGS
jgi:hypothetical protein